ncbi:STM3941 family protein [Mesorhizobium sp. NFR06]|uniref:STM3941 family protein n=1 Tax=Mesorhizobium sp. NFR06 TaxID=1566290 RepID=UPI00122D1CEC|nr:STM3941 family protein [Mesorhizobium sp. NFR06]
MGKTVELIEPRVIRGSRGKALLLLFGCLIFVLAGIGTLKHHPNDGQAMTWTGIIFFGLGVPVAISLLIRPQTLALDRDGFILDGGLLVRPKKVAWRDVKGFHVWRPRNRSKSVGYDFEPGARKETALMRVNRRLGAEDCLPGGWQYSPDKMVEILNSYRLQALTRQSEVRSE